MAVKHNGWSQSTRRVDSRHSEASPYAKNRVLSKLELFCCLCSMMQDSLMASNNLVAVLRDSSWAQVTL